jgi:hypothetical protein
MQLEELYKPKISKTLSNTAFDYFNSQAIKIPGYDKMREQNEFIKKLKKMGWEFLDDGAYSNVFANPKKDYVLKINKFPDNGYATYVNMIKRARNIHFPKISDMKHLDIFLDGYTKIYYVYLIEKLYEFKYDEGTFLADIVKKMIEHPNATNAYWFSEEFLNIISYRDRDIQELIKKYVTPSLIAATKIISHNTDINNCKIDMHGRNIMKRNDGTIVITDPYV